jgi:hypothetical protein
LAFNENKSSKKNDGRNLKDAFLTITTKV